jgi:hypothetical protein
MTFHGRSLDDMPLAAYGGSGLELDDVDESRPEAASDPHDAEPDPAGPGVAAETPPGPFAYAVPSTSLPDDNFGTGVPAPARTIPPVLGRAVRKLRTSRVAAGSAFMGVILVGLLLLNGSIGKPSAAGAQASASAAPVVAVTPEPGNATLEISGKTEQSFTFTGASGAGTPGAPLSVTWADASTNTLGLEGTADRGTRSTDAALVLSFTVVLDDAPVTFTSSDGECTIGMAVHPRNVSGTFSCKKLQSDDGKVTINATGSYKT